MTESREQLFRHYLQRFTERFGDKPNGTFVKHGKVMIQRLSAVEFDQRYEDYVRLQEACRRMLTSGATISDAIVLDFQEATAWLALEPPDVLSMFRGEVGDASRQGQRLRHRR